VNEEEDRQERRASQQPANRAHLSFPQDWDDMSEAEQKAACLAMADQMTAGLSPWPR
jgi:hypothetical protein